MKERLKKVLGRGKLAVLAVVLTLTVGTASTALAANGGNFILGVLENSATAITKLTANIPNNALHVANTSTDPGATALRLETAASNPPMRVDSGKKVKNLNVDKLDDKDSTEFLSSNSTYVVYSSAGGTPNYTHTAKAACDAGDRVIGGGYGGLDYSTTQVVWNAPAEAYFVPGSPPSTNNAWYVGFKNGSTGEYVAAWAVCADFGTPHSY